MDNWINLGQLIYMFQREASLFYEKELQAVASSWHDSITGMATAVRPSDARTEMPPYADFSLLVLAFSANQELR